MLFCTQVRYIARMTVRWRTHRVIMVTVGTAEVDAPLHSGGKDLIQVVSCVVSKHVFAWKIEFRLRFEEEGTYRSSSRH
jgi:hypothetical protein